MKLISRYHYKHAYRRVLALLFDLIGYFFFLPCQLAAKPLNPSKLKKILVIRNDQLGDVLMALPAIKALNEKLPHTQIDILVSAENASIVKQAFPSLNVIPFKYHWFSKSSFQAQRNEAQILAGLLKENHYDLGIDFRGDLRNILLMLQSKIPYRLGYGVTGGGFLLHHCPSYPTTSHQVLTNFNLLTKLGVSRTSVDFPSFQTSKPNELIPSSFKTPGIPTLILHPGAGFATKHWPLENFQDLIKKIQTGGHAKIILLGTEEEKNKMPLTLNAANTLDLRGKTRLDDLAAILKEGDLYLGNDSGPAHLAAAIGLPLIILFSGTNRSEIWKPWSSKLTLIQHAVPCSPCEARECPLIHHDCMRKISVAEVGDAVQKQLSKISRDKGSSHASL